MKSAILIGTFLIITLFSFAIGVIVGGFEYPPYGLKHFRVLVRHLSGTSSRPAADKFFAKVIPVFLGLVTPKSLDLLRNVLLFKNNEGALWECPVVPRNLVAQHSRLLESSESLPGDGFVILVCVVCRGQENQIRPYLLFKFDHVFQYLLTKPGELSDWVIQDCDLRIRDSQDLIRLPDLFLEDVSRPRLWNGGFRRGEGDIEHLFALGN